MSVVSDSTLYPGGLAMQSPRDRPDRVPLKKGEYSLASRALGLSTYFLSGALAINLSQILGTPLYLVNQDWYNAWIAFTKQSFGLLTMSLTQAFAPTKVVVSGDKSVRGQLRKSADGNLVLDFPERLVLIANHQIYTDWLYLWWMAYCNGMHGRLFIILKESLKKIPVIGWGMQLSQFIFLKRNWEQDRPHMAEALQKLNNTKDAMWLLLFPEGTNLAPSTREKSKAWADKQGRPDMWHTLMPRTTGLQFCLEELRGTVDYLYDCTIAYEGVPRGQFAQDIFTLKAGYLEGRPPKSVHMHWRRWAIKDIPLHNQKVFELWTIARWREKDLLIEKYLRDGKFPADTGGSKYPSGKIIRGTGHSEVQIRSSHWYEFLQIFAPMGVLAMVIAVFYGALPQSFWNNFNKQALQTSAGDLKKTAAQTGTQAKAVSGKAANLTLDDIFDANKQEASFKKGAVAVQQWLNTPGAQKLMNRVDFVSQFYQDPQKTITETVTGQRKDFMHAIKEEEDRRKQLNLPTSAQNAGKAQGKFWRDLQKVDQGREPSVISSGTSKPPGTFWKDLKAAEQKKAGLNATSRGTFWDQMKREENNRHGTVMTISSGSSTAVESLQSLSSLKPAPMKPSSTVVGAGQKKTSPVLPTKNPVKLTVRGPPKIGQSPKATTKPQPIRPKASVPGKLASANTSKRTPAVKPLQSSTTQIKPPPKLNKQPDTAPKPAPPKLNGAPKTTQQAKKLPVKQAVK